MNGFCKASIIVYFFTCIYPIFYEFLFINSIDDFESTFLANDIEVKQEQAPFSCKIVKNKFLDEILKKST